MNQSFETTTQPLNSNNYSNNSFSINVVIVILLLIVFITLFLGMDLLSLLGRSIDNLIEYADPLFSHMAYKKDTDSESTATTNQAGDVSSKHMNNEMNIQNNNMSKNEPVDDKSETPIQKPMTSDKTSWCLIGEYQGKHSCVSVKDSTKCMSGQVFPNEKMCLNPTKTA